MTAANLLFLSIIALGAGVRSSQRINRRLNVRKHAFVDEYLKMAVRGVNNPNTYNIIWSPRRKLFIKAMETVLS